MATFDADTVRACALELQERTRDLYFDVLTIYQTARAWTLNSLDSALPLPFEVKVQVDAYRALSLDKLRLEPWQTNLQGALPGDTLTYPPPGTLSGQIEFDEIAFQEIIF